MKRARTKPAPQRRTHRARWVGLLALVVLLAACGEAHVVRRYDAPGRLVPAPRHVGAGEIEVIRGDTLYGIAFRNGMDFRDLAAINGIEPPYTIYVGQILKLHGEHAHAPTPFQPVMQTPPSQHPVRVMPQPVMSAPVPARAPQESMPTPFESVPSATPPPAPRVSAPIAATPSPSNPSMPVHPPLSAPAQPVPIASAPVQSPPPQPSPAPRIVPAISQTPSAAIIPADVAMVGGVHWRWPAKGTLLDRFMAGDATKQGIDIGGNAGDPVFAASDGVVVYSGSGLVGYGELIIIKHSDEWLSAYGHNRKRLVQEGQRVKAGQPIAEMGNSGAPRDELHFEIRRNGRPVDPLQYLPAR